MGRLSVGLLVVACAALVIALPAGGKERVKATLTSAIPLDAKPGARLHVAWTLAYRDHGRLKPFGAGGVFVRLLSASGAEAETGFSQRDSGEFSATVAVPEGGIGDVEIGLRGWASGPAGTRRSDLRFPITNDPLPGPARVAPTAPGERDDGGSRAWIVVVAACALIAASVVGVALARRRHPLPASS